ncbi:MAG: hypothetical protein ACRCX1_03415 [Bacteroidales bacterium]
MEHNYRKYLLSALLLTSSIQAQEYKSLAGKWNFRLDNHDKGVSEKW